ncbi:MAG: glycoside hydrolase family 2 protein [Bacteroidales bacterium]
MDKADKWYKAEVPGTVISDLYLNNLIRHPFYGSNVDSISWVSNHTWVYENIFDLPDSVFLKKHIEFDFNFLVYAGKIILNDSLLNKSDQNKWTTELNYKKLLKQNKNHLKIIFEPPQWFLKPDDSVFSNFGFLRTIKVKGWDDLKIADFNILNESLSGETAELKFSTNVFSEVDTVVNIKISNHEIDLVDSVIKLKKGKNLYEFRISYTKPLFWWPNGAGKPSLYDFIFAIYKNKQLSDYEAFNYGFRKLKFEGNRMLVNDIPVFIKGASFKTQNIYFPLKGFSNSKSLLESAAAAGINLLYLLDDGIGINEEFLSKCDSLGLMVWYDFVKKSTVDIQNQSSNYDGISISSTIEKIKRHPSVVMNGKTDIAFKNFFDFSLEKEFNKNNYKLISEVSQNLPATLASNRYGKIEDLKAFQSYPLVSSMKSFLDEKQFYRYSDQLKSHQKDKKGFDRIQQQILDGYPIPGHIIPYILVSQLVQAEDLSSRIKKARRNKIQVPGYIFNDLNEVWPSVSSSGIDYYGRWKALMYFIRKANAPIIIDTEIVNDKLNIHIISDEIISRKARLELHLIDFYGEEKWADEVDLIISPFSSKNVYVFNFKENLPDSLKAKTLLHISLKGKNYEIAREDVYFKKYKDLELPDPDMVYNITKKNGKMVIQLMTDYLARVVFIDYPEDKGNFSDNYFDLLPGEQRTIIFTPEYKGQKLEGVVGLRSLYDVY